MPADDIEDWVRFEGNKKSGRLPSDYLDAGILQIDESKMRDLISVRGGREAVAYRLGSAVMIGYAEHSTLFSNDPQDKTKRQVAMGIGKGELDATVGVWTWENQFATLQGLATKGRRMPTGNVPNWVTLV